MIEIIADTSPVHLLGESHVLSYANLVARDSDTGRVYVPSAKCLISLKAGDYCDLATGSLNPLLLEALQELSIAGKAGSGAQVIDRAGFACLALFAGDIDLHSDLYMQMDEQADIELAGQTPYPPARGAGAIPFDLVDLRLKEMFAPFFAGVGQLVAIGMPRIIIHALPPRSADDARARRWCDGKLIPAVARAKITWHANRLLADFAAEGGLPFVSTWDVLAPEGYLLPQFDLDGVHVTRAAAAVSFQRIIAAGMG